ncbi:MAG: hypothetical protein H6916_01330 [Novosphingobium sp.]|uniref:hypothetical protein n=1 Tax=Novosphingobium sp. TaxID=1874826 RepID=UPI002603F90A|nr:hypothetical protein [Novosphingobium sp.]MCP5385445.1 hypothetical protein [Novosphingobium sp.]
MTNRLAETIYAHTRLEYRPAIGERVRFWTGRGSQGYAIVRAIRQSRNLDCELFLLDPEPDAIKGADYWPRREKRAYWGPRDHGVTLAQIEHEPQVWFQNY